MIWVLIMHATDVRAKKLEKLFHHLLYMSELDIEEYYSDDKNTRHMCNWKNK